jgi:hypothetical protein
MKQGPHFNFISNAKGITAENGITRVPLAAGNTIGASEWMNSAST